MEKENNVSSPAVGWGKKAARKILWWGVLLAVAVLAICFGFIASDYAAQKRVEGIKESSGQEKSWRDAAEPVE